jgi:Lrp/AsnC family transcriptional regulator for asnA, asnC and gidA
MENYQIDNLDRGILDALMANARTAYAELAKQFGVSPGTIHVRVEKMKQAGIITGARIDVSPKQLGYDVCCFIGIILKSAKDYPSALARLESLEEVTEAYYTTGHYSIFIKSCAARSMLCNRCLSTRSKQLMKSSPLKR